MIINEQGNEVKCTKAVPTEMVSEEEQELIRAYLQGAVYAWCNCKKQEEFRFATFSGGDNYYWEGTYLYPLYDNQRTSDNDRAVAEAAKYGGMLLKQVLEKDKRVFAARKVQAYGTAWRVNVYSWTGKSQ